MRKLLFSLIFLGLYMGSALATQVPLELAANYAKIAYAKKAQVNLKSAADIKILDHHTEMNEDQPAYYIFNIEPMGFVIIAADDSYNPVLAFSDESHINFKDDQKTGIIIHSLSPHAQKIQYLQEKNLSAPSNVKKKWTFLKEASIEQLVNLKDPDGVVVPPLTTTTWNQGEFYNAFTPTDPDPEAPDGRTFCGCSPIAVAQVIKFHNYPARGNGSNTYEDPVYGTQTADFCNTTYNWENMPNALTSDNDDVAEFIYHVGVSTNTEYSTVYTSTYTSYVRDALVNYWNFDESANWFLDQDQQGFAQVAVEDLNRGRPLLLTGEAWSGGAFLGSHTWVADGYGFFIDANPNLPDEYFHYNWGWGGDNNGWFLDTGVSWLPVDGQVGTQEITFHWNRFVVHNLFPAPTGCPALSDPYTNTVGENATYIYGSSNTVGNEIAFRYRKVGTTAWTDTPTTNDYFYYISNLQAGTDYEFQVRKKCCPDSWSEYSRSEFFTTEGSSNEGCASFLESNLSTSSITETNAYVYTSTPYGANDNQFRYRYVGSIIWSFSDVSTNYYRYLSGLEPSTDYEFQVRHRCAADEWIDFGASQYFTTDGILNADCQATTDENLFTSGITENNVYLYSSQPYGKVDNQFRYRAIGTTEWEFTDIDDNYYRYLTGLTKATEYEFQVSHLCQGTTWTEFSFSHTFTTQGSSVECEAVDGDRLYFNSVSNQNAYIYTPQPYGLVANQFRYRRIGSGAWTNSTISTLYYRYLNDLSASTQYEYQVSHECSFGNWSDWSSSKTFTTTSGLQGGVSVRGKLLPLITDSEVIASLSEPLESNAYPNPVRDNLTYEVSKAFSSKSVVYLSDISGEVVKTIIPTEGVYNLDIDLSELSTGIYILQYESDYDFHVKRIIKH